MPPKNKRNAGAAGDTLKAKASKTSKAPVTQRDPTPRQNLLEGAVPIKIVSFNVDGIRAGGRLEDLKALVLGESPDLICLQETKLQAPWAEDWAAALAGYDCYWSFSTAQKGYAGTAAFVKHSASGPLPSDPTGPGVYTSAGSPARAEPKAGKSSKASKSIASFFQPTSKKQSCESAGEPAKKIECEEAPASVDEQAQAGSASMQTSGPRLLSVRFGIGHEEHDTEGRSITLEYEDFIVVNLYVPNSGQKLERLKYRLEGWNPALEAYVAGLEEQTGKPMVVLGDLNVAHADADVYNYFAPHLKKQAGCTIEERAAFTDWLSRGYVDAFRHVHGSSCAGAYTYWSTRANNRPENKGLRLDYFVCSGSLATPSDATSSAAEGEAAGGSAPKALRIVDCYCLPDLTKTSDHCPVALVLA